MQYFVEHSEALAMLPQIKRPGHDAGHASGHDDGEVEIEVVDVRNVDGSNVSDDDPTMLASNSAFAKAQAAHEKSANLNKGGAHPSARASQAPSHLKKEIGRA